MFGTMMFGITPLDFLKMRLVQAGGWNSLTLKCLRTKRLAGQPVARSLFDPRLMLKIMTNTAFDAHAMWKLLICTVSCGLAPLKTILFHRLLGMSISADRHCLPLSETMFEVCSATVPRQSMQCGRKQSD